MTTVEIVSLVVAGLLAATKWLTVAKPVWDRLPAVVAVVLPSVVAVLPLVAEQFGLVKTSGDLVTAVVAAVALVLPAVTKKDA